MTSHGSYPGRRRGRRLATLGAGALLLAFAVVTCTGWFGVPPALASPAPQATGALTARLEELSRTAPGVISVWFYDLSTHESFGTNADRVHKAASTIKIPIVIYLYHLAATHRVSLDAKAALQRSDLMDGASILYGAAEGTQFTLRELARIVLVHSDNIATNVLLRTLGVGPLVQYLNEIGIRYGGSTRLITPDDLWDNNWITPSDLGRAILHLWRMAEQSPQPWAEPLAFLKQTVHKAWLPGGLPKGVEAGNKMGALEVSFHDAGIVYHPRRPYVLVVMTEGMDEQTAGGYITQVSREVWRWQDGRPVGSVSPGVTPGAKPTARGPWLQTSTTQMPAKEPLPNLLSQALEKLSRSAPGVISVWFYDLTTGESVSMKADRVHKAASTIKIPVVIYLYHLADTNRVSLDAKAVVHRGDWMDGTSILKGVPESRQFTLRELARFVLVHSDNTATNVLLRTLGVGPLVQYLNDIGIRYGGGKTLITPHDLWHNNLITPNDLGLAFRHLWRMGQKSPQPWAEPLVYLKQTVYKEWLPRGLPKGVEVANKMGALERSFHDAGIVYHPRRPYILVVMTEGMDEHTAGAYITRVSREVWRWQDGRTQAIGSNSPQKFSASHFSAL